jgi:hypothetical protein
MKSLETEIRNLIIAIALEQDHIHLQRDMTENHEELLKLGERRERLSRLSSQCILNIDREIDFFKNN